jgi:microsomal dipeptidase-like Zn-dependent dipeptidase
MIADLHCHYPMHLLPGEHDPLGRKESWTRRIIDDVEEDIVGLVAHLVNDRDWDSGWRVSLDGLEHGGAQVVCSVLYWPPAEFNVFRLNGKPPLDEYFEYVRHQLVYVENDLRRQDPDKTRVLLVKSSDDLDRFDPGNPPILFLHCLEGGFHLGASIAKIDGRVKWLSQQGVLYITVAHLFYREVATNAPAIPKLTNAQFQAFFPVPDDIGLTDRGRAVVEAMYKHKVLIDISHMTELAIEQTFELVEQLDEKSGRAKHDYPIIATHVGMRDAGPGAQEYNLSAKTARRIKERGGVIGLITARHQMGETEYAEDTPGVLAKHLDAIDKALGGKRHGTAAIGTDFDGFIKPTLAGLESARDFKLLESWIRAARDGRNDAEGILCENAMRVIRKAFAGRERSPRRKGARPQAPRRR